MAQGGNNPNTSFPLRHPNQPIAILGYQAPGPAHRGANQSNRNNERLGANHIASNPNLNPTEHTDRPRPR